MIPDVSSGIEPVLTLPGAVPDTEGHAQDSVPQLPELAGRETPRMLLRTPSGFEVKLAPPEQNRELQCSVCRKLVVNPVHAPCGHSFCQSHLATGPDGWSDLDRDAELLRKLVEEQGCLFPRAREALATVGSRKVDEAVAHCQKTARLENHAVRVRKDVSEPQFSWGAVTHASVGVVEISEGAHAFVNFPQQQHWHCLVEELEIEPIADRVRRGVRVKLRAGQTPPARQGIMEGDTVGTVVSRQGPHVVVSARGSFWKGFVGEVGADTEVMNIEGALNRISAAAAKPAALARLTKILEQAAEAAGSGVAPRLILRGQGRELVLKTEGAVDLLRAVGLDETEWNPGRTLVVLEPTLTADEDLGQVATAARSAISELKKRLSSAADEGSVDNGDESYEVLLHVGKDQSASSFEELWARSVAGLRPAVLAALAPQGAEWTWQQRGWENEAELVDHLKKGFGKGPTAIVRWQTQSEAEQVAARLSQKSLTAEVAKMPEVSLSGDRVSRPRCWESGVPLRARARLKPGADATDVWGQQLPLHVDAFSIGTVNCEFLVCSTNPEDGSVNEPRLYTGLHLPKVPHITFFPSGSIEHVKEVDAIKPGVKVRAHGHQEPIFGWGEVQSSDVGVVQAVQCDGIVEVYFPHLSQLWKASLQDLDTEGLPDPTRSDCPVCAKPFPTGQCLAVDLAVDSQIRRFKDMEASLEDVNTGSQKQKEGSRPRLLRSRTHQDELKCYICFDLLVAPVTLPCGHSFCKNHIEVWLLEHKNCPMCKQRVPVEQSPTSKQSKNMNCPPELASALFAAQLEEEDARPGAGPEDVLNLQVNRMLESQLLRFFPSETEARKAEVAAEVWERVTKREPGYLERLRAFLVQHRAGAVAQLQALGVTPKTPLPGTRGGTLLMLATEQGLLDVINELLAQQADILATTSSAFGAGTSALMLAAGRGHVEVVNQFLATSTEWKEEMIADAMGSAIVRNNMVCLDTFLGRAGCTEYRNCIGFTALLTAVQARNPEAVDKLLACRADLEARTTSAGLSVVGAGCTKLNGTYQHSGKLQDRPTYVNTHGAVIYCKGWWKMAESMADTEREGCHRYAAPALRRAEAEPPTGPWTTDGCLESTMEPPPSVQFLAEAGAAHTPLLLAAKLGRADMVTQLLRARADADARVPSSGHSASHVAAAAGDLGVLRSLLGAGGSATGAGATLARRDLGGYTPLHTACEVGHALIVRVLLWARVPPDGQMASVGKDTNIKQPPDPLLLATACGQEPSASMSGSTPPARTGAYLEVVRQLLEARANVEPRYLHAAARGGAEQIMEELVGKRADVDARDPKSGLTPLVAALTAGASTAPGAVSPTGSAQTLLQLRASAQACASDGFTALMAASAHADGQELVKELLNRGAAANNARGPLSMNAGSLAAVRGSSGRDGWGLLHGLVRDGRASWCLPVVPRCTRGHPMEPLHAATSSRKPTCNGCGQPSLHEVEAVYWTCWQCNYDLCSSCSGVPPFVRFPAGPPPKELMQHLNSGLVELTSLGAWTALHYAAAFGREASVRELLAARANLMAVDASGMNPLHWAAFSNRLEVVELLLEAGASAGAADKRRRIPLSLVGAESLRFAFDALDAKAGSEETLVDVLVVSGAGEATGTYESVELKEGELRKAYHKVGPGGYYIGWQDGIGWGLFRGDVMLWRSTRDGQRCPLGGWEAAGETAVSADEAPMRLREAMPWRGGSALLHATPMSVMPPALIAQLRAQVAQLPPRPPVHAPQHAVTTQLHLPGVTITISTTGGGGAEIPPFELILEEMIRRGDLPSEPPAGCVQQ